MNAPGARYAAALQELHDDNLEQHGRWINVPLVMNLARRAAHVPEADWCRDEELRQTADLDTAPAYARFLANVGRDSEPPPTPTATVADLTRVNPALAGPIPCQGIAA